MQEEYCTLDPITRKLTLTEPQRIAGVESDEYAKGLKFKFPKTVDNIDLTQMQLRINFMNSRGEKDQYIVTDLKPVEGEENYIIFTWPFSRLVTHYRGLTKFVICAVKTDENGTITAEWNTALAQMRVLEGLEVDEPDVTPEEKDVISQLISICQNSADEAALSAQQAQEEAEKVLTYGPEIGENGNWFVGGKDTGKPSRGEPGPKGDPGDAGEKGDPGKPGANGETPVIGDNSNWFIGGVDTGKPSRGEKGDKGDEGDPGKNGTTPNIQIGTVETLPPGSQATVTNTGTTETPVFNFGIPQGVSGAGIDKWELISETTLNESVQLVEFKQASDGTPLDLSNFLIMCNAINEKTANTYAHITINDKTAYIGMLTINKQETDISQKNWTSSATFAGGLMISGYGAGASQGVSPSIKIAAAHLIDTPIKSIKLTPLAAGETFAANSIFKLYGVKIKEDVK